MDLTNPIAEGTVTITSVNVGRDSTTLNFEGVLGRYGRVFITHHLTSSDVARDTGQLEGNARTFMEDGTMVSAPLTGTWRRSRNQLTLFFLDNCDNGDQTFGIWEVDMVNKSGTVKAYSLK